MTPFHISSQIRRPTAGLLLRSVLANLREQWRVMKTNRSGRCYLPESESEVEGAKDGMTTSET
jgi:hypothetical protein